jgi:hypothetical protein
MVVIRKAELIEHIYVYGYACRYPVDMLVGTPWICLRTLIGYVCGHPSDTSMDIHWLYLLMGIPRICLWTCMKLMTVVFPGPPLRVRRAPVAAIAAVAPAPRHWNPRGTPPYVRLVVEMKSRG